MKTDIKNTFISFIGKFCEDNSEISNQILFFTHDILKLCTQQENIKLTHIVWKLFNGMICKSLILLVWDFEPCKATV